MNQMPRIGVLVANSRVGLQPTNPARVKEEQEDPRWLLMDF